MIDSEYSVALTVTDDLLACAVGSGDLRVFATPAMIAAMEKAACTLLSRFLEPGQTSVGIEMNVAHTAATPLGMAVTATAKIVAQEGRRVDFSVLATDATGEIGRGTHSRVIVDAARFQAKADGKCAQE